MTILEKETLVKICGANIKHFEEKGYEIPKLKNKWGKVTTPNQTKLVVKVTDLPKGSNQRVTKICDDCGKYVSNQSYTAILTAREYGDSKDRCKKCGHLFGRLNYKNNPIYEKSLEFFARTNNMMYLLVEFSNKNNKKPLEISYGTHDEYLWNCADCNSEYKMKMESRTISKSNCPYCEGRRVNHTNCLWTTHPEIAKLLKNQQRGYEITAGRNQKEEFVCFDCGHSDKKVVSNVVIQGFSCKCSDGRSYSEKFVECLLSQISVLFETEKIFDWSERKRYDFYIPFLNCIIETHGIQHYYASFRNIIGSRNLMEEQQNDRLKEKLAIENGIENYISIDCRKSQSEFITNNILESELSKLVDLSNIDWVKCHETACKSLVRVICDIWNKGIENLLEITEIVNLHRDSIRRYLKQGKELGWCDYDPNEARVKTAKNIGHQNAKAVIQLTKNNEYIKTWNSQIKASKDLGINNGSISSVCKGKSKYITAGGFKWMFKEDYESMLNK